MLKVHRHLLESSRRLSEDVRRGVPAASLNLSVGPCISSCLSNNHQFAVSKASLLPASQSHSGWFSTAKSIPLCPAMNMHVFFGIYSFNGLERDVITRISPLPWFGRCFEVFACLFVCRGCVRVCVRVHACVRVSSSCKSGRAFFSLGDSLITLYPPFINSYPTFLHFFHIAACRYHLSLFH